MSSKKNEKKNYSGLTFDEIDNRLKHLSAIQHDDEGRVLIPMTVLDDTDFLSPFSIGHDPVISADTADFLEHRMKPLMKAEDVHLVIYSDCITDEDRDVYANGIQNYFVNRYLRMKLLLRRNLWHGLLFLLAGVALFATMLLSSIIKNADLVFNMLQVIAWVFIWEVVDTFVFDRSELRKEQWVNAMGMSMAISYEPLPSSWKTTDSSASSTSNGEKE